MADSERQQDADFTEAIKLYHNQQPVLFNETKMQFSFRTHTIHVRFTLCQRQDLRTDF